MIRSAADLKVPLVTGSLLSRKGCFRQKRTPEGCQTEIPVRWDQDDQLKEMPQWVTVSIVGRAVQLRGWKYEVHEISWYQISDPQV
ncbi:MAG TPA: hypothetical protein DIT97_05865 [Gimesia maris]|uniref:Uncharacterized protein n=1 Tax=Gimesia maris TaxID=122 RepID=A0A3D3R313_9PLAN|nr:hypothetical protein [Gimesia maris]|tara:strand:+ start:82047 stop:82304 length:258 start_codon:yes stop_codon:yes gene_type:complete